MLAPVEVFTLRAPAHMRNTHLNGYSIYVHEESKSYTSFLVAQYCIVDYRYLVFDA